MRGGGQLAVLVVVAGAVVVAVAVATTGSLSSKSPLQSGSLLLKAQRRLLGRGLRISKVIVNVSATAVTTPQVKQVFKLDLQRSLTSLASSVNLSTRDFSLTCSGKCDQVK